MNQWIRITALALLSVVGLLASSGQAAEAKKIRVAVVTGGHPYDAKEFMKLFQGYSDITYRHTPQKNGGELFDDIDRFPYDVILLYNFNQQITPKQQENFVKLLDRGVGLVILHHANDAYPNWPLYRQIAGVESHFGKWKKDGVEMAPSDFSRSPVKFKVHIADPNHPITRGLKDYVATDETYCRRSFHPDSHVLLTTDEPSSDKTLSWVRTFHKARVCYLQSGHDTTAYCNPNYRTLVARAIRWTAGSDDVE